MTAINLSSQHWTGTPLQCNEGRGKKELARKKTSVFTDNMRIPVENQKSSIDGIKKKPNSSVIKSQVNNYSQGGGKTM